MNNLILCPKCGHLAGWDSWFQKYICTYKPCDWMGEMPKEKPHDRCDIVFERRVNETLWWAIMEKGYNTEGHEAFENETFLVRPYCWNDEYNDSEPTNEYLYTHNNEYHFWHKPSGFRLAWYKYPLRDPRVNIDITHEQFWDILHDCMNSIHPNSTYDINEWWH